MHSKIAIRVLKMCSSFFLCFWNNLNPFFARSCAATAGGFSILDLVSHFLAFNFDLFWNDFVVHPHYHDPFVIFLLLLKNP